MNLQRHTMCVLVQITNWIPDRVMENLAGQHKIQTRSCSATSHVMSMVYAHLAHSMNLNDIFDSLFNHVDTVEQIRNYMPPSRNGLSHINTKRDADMAVELFLNI